MTTATTSDRIATRLAELTKARAERKDELDLPRMMTQREVNAYLTETARLDAQVTAIRTAAATVATLPTLDADTTWRDQLTVWRAALGDELLAIKSPIRDKATKDRADDLSFSIRLIDHGFGIAKLPIVTLAPTRIGALMTAAGYETSGPGLRGPNGWRGSMKEVEQRIKQLTTQRTVAQAALDEALLTDEERAVRDAARAALRDAFNGLHVKGSADGAGYIVVDADGEPRDLDTLTDLERTAFEQLTGGWR